MQHRSPIRHAAASAGFTIIELMVTLTLAAILLGVAIPSFRGMIANNRIVTQSNDLVGAINFARSDAITRNASITLCRTANATATTCAGSLANWTDWIVRNPSAPVGSQVIRRGTVNTYGGTVKVTTDLTLDSMTFTSDGLARTGVVFVTGRKLKICTTSTSDSNIREVELGAGSRLSTNKSSGTC
jgi:type IV fimbrial biogenesis protein FimT